MFNRTALAPLTLTLMVALGACSDDNLDPPTVRDAGQVDLGADDQGSGDAEQDMGAIASDAELDQGNGLADDMAPDVAAEDMGPDLPEGPRDALAFEGVSIVEDLRSQTIRAVADISGGWYVAASTAGRDAVFGPGETDETTIDGSGQNGFRAIYAHYDASGILQTALTFTEYTGDPNVGATSQAKDLDVESDGRILLAGQFAGKVQFPGNTVWTTPRTTNGNSISISTEGFLVRIDPTTRVVTPVFRLASPLAGESNHMSSVVAHDDTDYSLAGTFWTSVTFPDGTVLNGTSQGMLGYVARFAADTSLDWVERLPGHPYLTDLDGDATLLRFSYASEFTLDDSAYSAPADGERGAALARIEADGSVAWIIRAENSASPHFHEPIVGPNGNIFVGARLESPHFPDLQTPPNLVGQHNYVLEIDPAGGTIVDAMALTLSEDDYLQATQLVFDDVGLLWAYVGYAHSMPVQVEPTYGDPFVLPYESPDIDGDGHNLMLAWDWSDKSLAYAHFVSTGGTGSLDDILRLSDGQILIVDHYFYDRTLNPMGASPIVLTNNVQGRDPDTAFMRYR